MSRFFGEDSYFGEGGYLDRQNQGQDRSGTTGPGGTCGDCGGTGDCIHCNGGVYPRRDGTTTLCGKCRGRGNRRHPYLCHACKGKGYGGKRCNTPTYQEVVERSKRPIGRAAYGQGSTSGAYGRSSFSMEEGTFDGYPSLWFRRDDGAKVIYYGPSPVNPDDASHGHAVILHGELIYKRPPGSTDPVINKKKKK